MNNKCVTLILVLPLMAFGQSLSLNDAIRAALANSKKIAQYSERQQQKQALDNEAWGNFLPTLSLDASYNHFNDPLEIDLSPIRDVIITLQAKNQVELTNIGGLLGGKPALTDVQKSAVFQQSQIGLSKAIPAFTEELKRQDNKYLSLTFTQPLFTGGKLLAAKKAAGADSRAAGVELDKTKNDAVKDVIEAYLNVLFMQDMLTTRRVVQANIALHKVRAGKLYAQGMVPRYQLIRAEAALAEAERNCMDDSVKCELAKLALANATGLEPGMVNTLKDTLLFRKAPVDSLTFLNAAIAANPYIKILEQKEQAAQAGYEAARANLMPAIAAFGKYECLPEYLSALEPRWVVGLKLQMNLFNGFRDYSKMQNYSHLENEIGFMKADIQKSLTLLMQKSMMQVNAAAARYQKLNSNMELADENLRVATKRAEAGTGIPLEIVDANSFYEKTRIERSAALLDYYKGYAQTLHTINRINDFANIWNQE
ncbi:MAG: TolC family protein [Ignavibacteriales bacterium]|nr:TolC family protein [Ignavibacteriales bacterium]